jgi:hypothetical protein
VTASATARALALSSSREWLDRGAQPVDPRPELGRRAALVERGAPEAAHQREDHVAHLGRGLEHVLLLALPLLADEAPEARPLAAALGGRPLGVGLLAGERAQHEDVRGPALEGFGDAARGGVAHVEGVAPERAEDLGRRLEGPVGLGVGLPCGTGRGDVDGRGRGGLLPPEHAFDLTPGERPGSTSASAVPREA